MCNNKYVINIFNLLEGGAGELICWGRAAGISCSDYFSFFFFIKTNE